MDDQELREGAERLMEEAHSYFKLMSKRGLAGGVVWLTDRSGAMVIFTRGEYRTQLLQNIELEIDAKKVFQFGTAETMEN
jgi:hypothetical protein